MVVNHNDKKFVFNFGENESIKKIIYNGDTVYGTDDPAFNILRVIVDPNLDEAGQTLYARKYSINGKERTAPNREGIIEIPIYEIIKSLSFMGTVIEGPPISHFSMLDLSDVDTSHVQNMSGLFDYCGTLESINLNEDFSTINVTNMSCMFRNCSSLTSIDLSHFFTSNVQNMSNMFGYTNSLMEIDCSMFDTQNVKNMESMFQYTGAKTINCSTFDLSQVTNTSYMFNCGVESLILDSFNMSNVTNYINMFNGGTNVLNYIRCTTAFQIWCFEHQDEINLPTNMREDGDGTWDLIDI